MLQNLINFLKTFFRKPLNLGVNSDTRPQEKKDEDYVHEERTITGAVNLYTSKILETPYPVENQNQTSACVPHGLTLALGIELKRVVGFFVRLSKMFVYRQRSNYPLEGTIFPEGMNLLRKVGSCLFESLATPYSEKEANSVVITAQMINEANIYKAFEYYLITKFNDIDSLATVAAQGHGVPILIYASYREWSQLYPQLWDNVTLQNAEVRHCITVLPNASFIENGIKYVTVQDSAWFGGLHLRYVSESFIKARSYGAGYFDKVTMTPGTGPYPKYTFTKTLQVGSQGPEVKALQNFLIHEGLLPIDCNTGLFAGRTLAGVRAFQNKYAADILLPLHLDAPTATWGSACIAKANKLCTS